jgi:hypothetical protein
VAVLLRIAQDLGVREVINSVVKKRSQGMTPGDYLLIASLNRAVGATSKFKIREWVESTTLPLHMKIDRVKLSSQNFWDHFDLLTAETVEAIGDAIARRAIELEKIPLGNYSAG